MNISQFTTEASNYAAQVDRPVLSAVDHFRHRRACWSAARSSSFSRCITAGRRRRAAMLPERKSREIEIGWTVATLFSFLFLFWWAASDRAHRSWRRRRTRWKFTSSPSNGCGGFSIRAARAKSTNCMCRPITNIRLAMTSQDVIHDLYLPALRLKQDILPDRYTYEWFNADKTGIFHFTCAEFCGTDHSSWPARWCIVTPQDYARWTAAQPEGDDLAHQGAALFRSLGCSGCHTPGLVGACARPARRLRARRAPHRRPHADRR